MTGGYTDTTGTEAQSGGFMSAANMTLNAQTINQIGGALQIVSSDGTVNAAATQQLVSSLQAQLGSEFQQSTVSSNLNTSFTAAGGFGLAQLAGIIVAVVAACLMQPEISTAIASVSGAADAAADAAFMAAQEGLTGSAITAAASAAGGTLAVGGLANTMLAVGLSSIASGALSQYVSTGQVNLGTDLSNGLISAVTAGITNGITFDASSGPGFNIDAPVEGVTAPSLAALSGVQNVAGALVPQAGAAAGSIPEELLATGADASIQAGVQTAIEGGSFLNNLKTDATQDAAADLAYAIGNENLPIEESALAHAALGCAASAAEGTGCAGGAIGAASSALLTPFIGQAVVGSGAATTAQTAVITALAALTGGVTAGLAGANAQAGAAFAENEAQNNCSLHECWNKVTSAFGSVFQSIGQWMATPNGQTTMLMVGTAGNTGEGLGGLSSGMTRAAVAETATELAADTVSADTPTLFRGTTQGYPGNPGLQQIGITPTTSNPAIATVFATGSGSSFGNGIVQIAEPADLVGIEISSMGNASTPTLAQLESEFAVSVAPSEFTNLSSTTITAAQARSILSDMNISIPSNIGVGDITSTLENTPQLTSSQIQKFLQLAKKLGGNL